MSRAGGIPAVHGGEDVNRLLEWAQGDVGTATLLVLLGAAVLFAVGATVLEVVDRCRHKRRVRRVAPEVRSRRASLRIVDGPCAGQPVESDGHRYWPDLVCVRVTGRERWGYQHHTHQGGGRYQFTGPCSQHKHPVPHGAEVVG